MDLTVFQSSLTLFEILCVIIVFASIFLRSRFFREVAADHPSWTTRIVLTIFFGVMSIFGTLSGLSIYGAVVNVRDLGPMAAGLICGPAIGIGSGIIGGVFRFAQGGPYLWTGLSAPILSGFLGGIMFLANRRRFVPVWVAVLYIGLSETLISCYTLVLVTKPAEFFTVVTTVAIPMVVFNALGMLIFASFVHYTFSEQNARRDLQRMELEVESKRNLSTIINTIAFPVYVLDREYRFTLVNDRFCGLAGRSRDALLKKTPAEVFNTEDSPIHHEMSREVFRTQTTMEAETEETLADGKPHTLFTTSSPYTDAAGHEFIVGIVQDITERKKMQVALAESEAWYRTLFEHTGAATIIIEEDGTIGQANSEFSGLTGWSREEIEGKMKWKDISHPDDLEIVRKYHHGRRTDPASVPSHYTIRIRTRSGSLRTLHAVVALIPGTKKSIASYVDISELKRTEEALTLVNRKLNLLSSITRHDIINQLMILKGYLALLGKKAANPELIKYIEHSCTATANIEDQINFTRDYQDMGVKAPVWQNMRSTIIGAKGALPTGNISITVDEADVEIFADPLFEKVFYNLIDNSLKYGGAGMHAIRVSWQENEAGLAITYEDDGEGISGEDRPHLFERGYGRHTGFGLFLSREILSITGITITETSEPGKGARFEILVPKSAYRVVPGTTG